MLRTPPVDRGWRKTRVLFLPARPSLLLGDRIQGRHFRSSSSSRCKTFSRGRHNAQQIIRKRITFVSFFGYFPTEQTPGEHTPPLLTRGLTWLSAGAGTRGQGTLGTAGHHLAGTWPRFQTYSAVGEGRWAPGWRKGLGHVSRLNTQLIFLDLTSPPRGSYTQDGLRTVHILTTRLAFSPQLTLDGRWRQLLSQTL